MYFKAAGIVNEETSEDYMAINNSRKYIEFLVLSSEVNFKE